MISGIIGFLVGMVVGVVLICLSVAAHNRDELINPKSDSDKEIVLICQCGRRLYI